MFSKLALIAAVCGGRAVAQETPTPGWDCNVTYAVYTNSDGCFGPVTYASFQANDVDENACVMIGEGELRGKLSMNDGGEVDMDFWTAGSCDGDRLDHFEFDVDQVGQCTSIDGYSVRLAGHPALELCFSTNPDPVELPTLPDQFTTVIEANVRLARHVILMGGLNVHLLHCADL
eukprot:SAG11_NODE_7716_length_1105_cov_1.471173_1_plen_175_part_00